MSRHRPSDCPPGLWEIICGTVQDATQFFKEHPDLYEELKAQWQSTPKKPAGIEKSRKGPVAGTLAQEIRDTANRIAETPEPPFSSELRGRMTRAVSAVERDDFTTAARELHSVLLVLLDTILKEPRRENKG